MSEPKTITDESQVPAYELPPLLVKQDGTPVTDAAGWRERRAELLKLYEDTLYGRLPDRSVDMAVEPVEQAQGVMGGLADRLQVDLVFSCEGRTHALRVLVYLPAQRTGPVPALMMLNFHGNQTVNADPAIVDSLGPEIGPQGESRARGGMSRRYPVDLLLERGYALITAARNNLAPDAEAQCAEGVLSLLDAPRGEGRPSDAPGAIAAWSWGLMRMMDWAESLDAVDTDRLILAGHSRLGKASLWAGVQDERFPLVVSNDSGCGGAALYRRGLGETLGFMARSEHLRFWFCPQHHTYADREADLPFDQHALLSLVAPRTLYVCSAQEDQWADPRGEFLAAYHAGEAYRLLGKQGIASDEMPAVNEPVGSDVRYHIRSGKHDVTRYDVEQWLNLADEKLPG